MDLPDNTMGMVILGGALIGLAAGLLFILTGRIMSASAMVGSLMGGREDLAATSITFIGGVILSPLFLTGVGFAPQLTFETPWPFLIAGGFLVGFGARFGGSSLGGAITGMGMRSGHAITTFLIILGGAGAAVFFQQTFASGGIA